MKNLSQTELAELAHINASYISLIESDKRTPSWEVLNKLAVGLGVSVSVLVGTREL
jgi:transcriptional regulator with XRE-family HTH domain